MVVFRFNQPTTTFSLSPRDGQGFSQMIAKLSNEAFVQSLQLELAAKTARIAELEANMKGTADPSTPGGGIPGSGAG